MRERVATLLRGVVSAFVGSLSPIKRELHLKAVTMRLNRVRRLWLSEYAGDSWETTFVVFSKDRPTQLFALLESLGVYSESPFSAEILYAASNSQYRSAYQEVFGEIRSQGLSIGTHPETEKGQFRSLLIRILENVKTPRVCFLVDDIVFLRAFRLQDIGEFDLRKFVPSLRLGRCIRFSYMTKAAQDLPVSLRERRPFLEWVWRGNSVDWSYPMSVDGNFFLRSEMLVLARDLEYHSPNSFESALVSMEALYLDRSGVCFEDPVIVNIPSNIVQSDFGNAHGDWTAEELLAVWESGQKIDWSRYAGLQYPSVHMELPYRFVPRKPV